MSNIFNINIPTKAASQEAPHRFHDALFGASVQTRNMMRETIVARTVQTILGEIPQELLRDEQSHAYTAGPQPKINHDQLAKSVVQEMVTAPVSFESATPYAADTQNVVDLDTYRNKQNLVSDARTLVGSQFDQSSVDLTAANGPASVTAMSDYLKDHRRYPQSNGVQQEPGNATSQSTVYYHNTMNQTQTFNGTHETADTSLADIGYQNVEPSFGLEQSDAA